ncbi:DNA replication ATP-dependent helicase/nuclease DNA2 isoform X2 [Ischnura elegans]|uniref:DNA replication ATP-dependent helicase/nuclease DNA2 isoform X2 n=1 Tax=Ischnura elegans TaxID=197161 RepID=UPI001ED895CB|nr:DNA replication ATP-dependent helicase/nuclease DNA2 isoform X2 [Ischnura elegans]
MRKRKMVADHCNQQRISKFFGKTVESGTSDVGPNSERNKVFRGSGSNTLSVGPVRSKDDLVTLSANGNSNVDSERSCKPTSVGTCIGKEIPNYSPKCGLDLEKEADRLKPSKGRGEGSNTHTADGDVETTLSLIELINSSTGEVCELPPIRTGGGPSHEEESEAAKTTEKTAVPLSELVQAKASPDHGCCPSSVVFEEDLFLLDDWDSFCEDEDADGYTLDLSKVHRCRVEGVCNGPAGKILTVSSTGSKERAKVLVQGMWLPCRAAAGDVVSIQCAAQDDATRLWMLGGEPTPARLHTHPSSSLSGLSFLVEEPDMLISGTTVVGSLFCARKSVLAERFRGFEAAADACCVEAADVAQPQAAARSMLIGSLVHEVLQKCLSSGLCKPFDVGRACHDVLRGRKAVWDMYAAGVIGTSAEVRQEVMQFVPKEMPLELKTGRGSYSAEHQGQVLLYSAMMEAVGGAPVDSGLLLYLRAESMREISASRHALRDLIMLRNDLVSHLKAGPRKEGLRLPSLPQPIFHRKACASCPFLLPCAAHLRCGTDGVEALTHDHPLRLLVPPALKHLTDAHFAFFAHWSSLIAVEVDDCARNGGEEALLWTMEPNEREAAGRCVSGLRVDRVWEEEMGLECVFVHAFARGGGGTPSAVFTIGERVVVSCSGVRVAIASGCVLSADAHLLCVGMDRDLRKRFGQTALYHVDKWASSSGSSSLGLTSLAMLLVDAQPALRLRQLLVDGKAPTFRSKLSGQVVSKCMPVLEELNESQARAVLRALAAQDFLLIKGLPGTGKSTVIVALLRALVATGRSVLLTGHTHSSVDGVLCRLLDADGGASILRLGATHRIHPRLHPHGEEAMLQSVAACHSPADLHTAFLSKAVVGATCLGLASHPILARRTFDVCVMDEAGQVLLPIALRPLFACRSFVLVGDPEQLPPVVRSPRARRLGMEQTLFDALYSPDACVTLGVQYRMNAGITQLANALSYGHHSASSRLVCANQCVAQATLNISDTQLSSAYADEPWVLMALSSHMDQSVVFVDTGDVRKVCGERAASSGDGRSRDYANVCEASVVVHLVRALLMAGVAGEDVGVIAPYGHQVSLLQRVLPPGVEASTVDRFQGRDKEAIVYSFTRFGDVSENENKAKDLELLSDQRRLTVAITRAKRKLICVGQAELLGTYAVLRRFLSLIPKGAFVRVDDLSWPRILLGPEVMMPASAGGGAAANGSVDSGS